MEIHIHIHHHQDPKLDVMMELILGELKTMAIDLTNLRKEVQDLKDETDSAVALITGLADQISSIPQSKDKATQAALDDLVQQLNDNALPLANAIKANTVTLPNPPGPVGNANPTPPVVPASDNPNPNPNPADTGRTNK